MHKDQRGFGAVECFLLVVILGIIGFAGWYVWNSNKVTEDILSNTNVQSRVEDSAEAKSYDARTAEMIKYKNETAGFSIDIPKYMARNDYCTGPADTTDSVAMTVLEENGIFYLAPETIDLAKNILTDDNVLPRTSATECERHTTTVELIRKDLGIDYRDFSVVSAKSQQDMQAWIQSYGKDSNIIISSLDTDAEGDWKVGVLGCAVAADAINGPCELLSGGYILRLYEKQQKMLHVSKGNAKAFYVPGDSAAGATDIDAITYDERIFDSITLY